MKLQCQTPTEAYNLIKFVTSINDIPGDCLEAGVYRGESAAVIRENTNKKLWLFDSFDDFVVGPHDSPDLGGIFFTKGSGEPIYQEVLGKFEHTNTELIRGEFPESAGGRLNDVTFAFVHLDMDVYEATMKALALLYPKMSPGGIMLFHDYIHNSIEIKKGIDDFFSDKPEKVVVPIGSEQEISQGYIIKQ